MKDNYSRYLINLRKEDDKALIEYIEKHKGSRGTTDIFREALEFYLANKN